MVNIWSISQGQSKDRLLLTSYRFLDEKLHEASLEGEAKLLDFDSTDSF